MRFFFLAFLFVLLFLSEKVQGQAVSWGDQGNGTYINPNYINEYFYIASKSAVYN